MSRLTDLLALSHVPRWSIVRHHRPQSVAEHTFRVMAIATELADRLGIDLDYKIVRYILEHDAHESRIGDVPSTAWTTVMAKPEASNVCRWMGPVPESEPGRRLARLADLIEAATFIDAEGAGRHARSVADGCYRAIKECCPAEWSGTVAGIIADIMTDEGR